MEQALTVQPLRPGSRKNIVAFERKAFNQTSCFYRLDTAAVGGVDADMRDRYVVVSSAVRCDLRSCFVVPGPCNARELLTDGRSCFRVRYSRTPNRCTPWCLPSTPSRQSTKVRMIITPPPTTTRARNAFNGEPHAVPEGKLALEFQTIKALEIIANSRTGKHEKSLFGVINHTQASYVVWATNARTRVCRDRCDCEQTRVGQRLLRATLLSPSNDAVTINLRLDCIGELLSSQEVFFHCNEVGQRARHTDERPSARGVLTGAILSANRFCVSSRIWTVSSISWSSNPAV